LSIGAKGQDLTGGEQGAENMNLAQEFKGGSSSSSSSVKGIAASATC
jgi:hypothetical protein